MGATQCPGQCYRARLCGHRYDEVGLSKSVPGHMEVADTNRPSDVCRRDRLCGPVPGQPGFEFGDGTGARRGFRLHGLVRSLDCELVSENALHLQPKIDRLGALGLLNVGPADNLSYA